MSAPYLSKMPTCTATNTQDTTCCMAPTANQANQANQANLALKTKLPPVPDLENRRYCRACQIMLPVSAFPAGKRRYLCKRHIWERVQRPSKERARANVDKRRLWTIWKTCYHDAMRTFKHRRILLLQRDIQQTLAQIDAVADFVESNADVNQDVHQEAVSAELAEASPEFKPGVHQEAVSAESAQSNAIAFMPANPEQQLSRDNVVIVDKTARRVLLQAFREGGAQKYISELGALD